MKKLLLSLLLTLAFGPCQNQIVYKYWVSLSDKAPTSFSIHNPTPFLSQRALDRRQRQQIPIDTLDLPVCETYLQAFRDKGFLLQNRSKWLNGVMLFSPDSTLASSLDSLPFVRTYTLVAKDSLPRPHIPLNNWSFPFPPIPYDTAFSPGYYGLSYPQIRQLNGVPLHRAGYQGQNLIIGVCDAGFPGVDTLSIFDSLLLQGRLLASRDFVWPGNDPFNISQHGTMVLSTMAAYSPGAYVGTAPQAAYVLCRTENALSETPAEMYNWVAAAEYLDSLGADILTSSLGYLHFDNFSYTPQQLDGHTTPIAIAAAIAVSKGMLLLNAAGNNGLDSLPLLNSPADVASVLTVGAVREDSTLSPFSSPGPTADGRIKPDVVALGSDIVISNESGFCISNGTSFATPVLAGMMASLWQSHPSWTPQQLCDTIRSWGSHAASPDNYYGYGIPDMGRATDSPAPLAIPTQPTPQPLIWPIPASDRLTVQHPSLRQIVIYTTQGTIVKRQTCHSPQTQINLSDLPSGIYFISTTTPSATFTERLIKH